MRRTLTLLLVSLFISLPLSAAHAQRRDGRAATTRTNMALSKDRKSVV